MSFFVINSHLIFFFPGYEEAKAAGEAEPQLTLLTDITGSFRPGVLTALMGVSGAGKVRLTFSLVYSLVCSFMPWLP